VNLFHICSSVQDQTENRRLSCRELVLLAASQFLSGPTSPCAPPIVDTDTDCISLEYLEKLIAIPQGTTVALADTLTMWYVPCHYY
jgi:hypothetical protein